MTVTVSDLSNLRFHLPPELEAKEPPEARGLPRDQVRLLVSERSSGGLRHARFADLPASLRRGDLLVVNDSATLAAAVPVACGQTDTPLVLHLSTPLPGTNYSPAAMAHWVVEPRRRHELRSAPLEEGERQLEGARLHLPQGATADLLREASPSRRLWVARLRTPLPLLQYLARWGQPIAYRYAFGGWALHHYQSIFAVRPGSAEMPSAGRPFTVEVLSRLQRMGVEVASLTLHTGVSSLERHEAPYPEYFEVPPVTAHAIHATRRRGGRVVAVGTTVVRALETAARGGGVGALSGWSDTVIHESHRLQAVDGLLTGLHEPQASHLNMLQAFLRRPHLEAAYQSALAGRYLWHEFGDVHLIL